jgi:hypothetical protein
MKSPFPGMDPYLENTWRDVHHRLCTYAADALQPQVRPALIARIEERLVIESFIAPDRSIYPDVRIVERNPTGGVATVEAPATATPLLLSISEGIEEGFIQIIDPAEGDRVVTVIEFLSKTNKDGREGERQYRQKAIEAIDGGANLVEIDLLREGGWVMQAPISAVPKAHRSAPYKVCIRRAGIPSQREYYAIYLKQRLPEIRIPLRPTDKDAVLDLQKILDQAYNNGAYDEIDYSKPPVPPFDADTAEWAAGLVQKARPTPQEPTSESKK